MREKDYPLGEEKNFAYTGSVKEGTHITYGSGFPISVSKQHLQELSNHFQGRCVPCGTSRTNPPTDSLGEWLLNNVSKTAIASYVAAILVDEGYAIKRGPDIKFKN